MPQPIWPISGYSRGSALTSSANSKSFSPRLRPAHPTRPSRLGDLLEDARRYQHDPPAIGVLEGQRADSTPVRVLGIHGFVPGRRETLDHVVHLPVVVEVQDEQVVRRGGWARAAIDV